MLSNDFIRPSPLFARLQRFLPGAITFLRTALEKHLDLFAQAALVSLSAFLHFWRLEIPEALVFDEIYFSVFANNYLERTAFFDSHPPLGKYLIALGIRFFGFVPLGYRVMNALCGVAVVILIYRLALQLFGNRRLALLAGLFAALDGVLLVESRAGLINIYAVCFCLAAYHFFLKSGSAGLAKPHWVYLAGAGICIGAATAVKWIGAASFGIIFGMFLWAKAAQEWQWLDRLLPVRRMFPRLAHIHPDAFVVCCIFLPAVVYGASFIIHLEQNPEYNFFELQRQIYGYHAHLQAGHGYASAWWGWPLLLRPVNYYWQVDQAAQQVMTILNIGNPLLWWLAIPATAFGLWHALFRRNLGAAFALAGIAAHYLPFAMISRASFLYHFMGALPFTIMLLAFAVDRLWQAQGWRRELAALAVTAIIFSAAYFYPIWTALPIPIGAFYQRMWLTSWI